MRTIKFRGKRVDSGKWVFGSLCQHSGRFEILVSYSDNTLDYDLYEVDPATLGQFTGILDKDGKDIWGDDILKIGTKHGFNSDLLDEFKHKNNLESINGIGLHFIGIVRIDLLRGLMFENPKNGYQEPMFTRHIDIFRNHSDIEVIGNVHDNPELINKRGNNE